LRTRTRKNPLNIIINIIIDIKISVNTINKERFDNHKRSAKTPFNFRTFYQYFVRSNFFSCWCFCLLCLLFLLAQQHQRQHCRMVQQNSVKMHKNASSIMERRTNADCNKFLGREN
jgi:hypothetical protein